MKQKVRKEFSDDIVLDSLWLMAEMEALELQNLLIEGLNYVPVAKITILDWNGRFCGYEIEILEKKQFRA